MHATPLQPEPQPMTVTEYFAFQDGRAEKYEYVAGRVYLMTGASLRHNIITSNINTSLSNQLRDSDCIVPSNDTRVKEASATVSVRFPDVLVICGEPHFFAEREDTVTNPLIIIEVLSPSTTLIDYNEKLSEYIALPSLQEYLIVSQHLTKIERYLRPTTGNDWLYTQVTALDGEIVLTAVAAALKLRDVYRKVTFD